MTFDEAVAALEGAVETDSSTPEAPSLFAQPAPAAPAPVEATPEQAAAESAPQGESATDPGAAPVANEPVAPAESAAVVDTFDDGKFNPDTLSPELQPAWHQLQATFTRKTQEVAEQRKQLEALGVDMGGVTEAVQLYQQLQDPANWPRFQQEISQLMEQRGIAAPTGQPVEAVVVPPTPSQQGTMSELDVLAQTYPELAPLATHVRQLEERLTSTSSAFEAQQSQLARERQELAVAGEFQRQENVLRETGLTTKDMERVYTMAPAYNGNLLAANEAYQEMRNAVLTDYLATKTEAQATPVAPFGGGAVTSSATRTPTSLEDATDIALETLRAAGLDTLEF